MMLPCSVKMDLPFANRSTIRIRGVYFTMIEKIRSGLCLTRELILRAEGKSPHVLDTLSSLKILSNSTLSLSRYGDGEFKLIAGESLTFQPFDRGLQQRLSSILSKPQSVSHRVAIPYAMHSVKGLTLRSSKFWLCHCNEIRKTVYPLLDAEYQYLDSQVSRFYINRRDRSLSSAYLSAWQALWKEKDILLIEGAETRFGAGNDLLDGANSIKRILCPSVDAWARYSDILASTLKHSASCDLVLLALGPTATVLAYDLSQNGIRAIDSGNLDMEYEWMKRGSRNQVAVEGKYTMEAIGGTQVTACKDERYESQIIEAIF